MGQGWLLATLLLLGLVSFVFGMFISVASELQSLTAFSKFKGAQSSVLLDDLAQVRASVLELLELPEYCVVYPGHTDETTIGRERESNPFVRVWLGTEPEGTERVRVAGRDATLVVWSPDYDGKGKAWVRFDDGTDAIVGGSRVER